jgi:hypothetical protein
MVEPCLFLQEQVFLTPREYPAFRYPRCATCKMKHQWAYAAYAS